MMDMQGLLMRLKILLLTALLAGFSALGAPAADATNAAGHTGDTGTINSLSSKTGNPFHSGQGARELLALASPSHSILLHAFSGAVASPRYRVTINGFEVRSRTKFGFYGIGRDDAGGRGDEVFIETLCYRLSKNGRITKLPSIKSLTMGNIKKYPRRVKAGTVSRKYGGLGDGDKFPNDLTALGQVLSRPGKKKVPPMVVFQGTLTAGQEAIIIIPTLWEWDKSKKKRALNGWSQWHNGYLQQYMKRFPGKFLKTPFRTPPRGLYAGMRGNGIRDFGMNPVEYRKRDLRETRPIGIDARTDKKRPKYYPGMIVLNEHTGLEAGKAQMYILGYWDRGGAAGRSGDYTMFIKVERLQTAPLNKAQARTKAIPMNKSPTGKRTVPFNRFPGPTNKKPNIPLKRF